MSNRKSHLTVVSPVYRAEAIVPTLVLKIKEELEKITPSFTIILVEDGGPDKSWDAINRETEKDSRVKGLKLSRNFGQHYAITAGLDHCNSDWIIVMDCDLQDKPSEIPNLYKKANEGYDIVLARRVDRQDAFFKKTFSRLFYKSLGYLTGTKQDPAIANFGIYSGKVIDALNMMREPVRYFPSMIKWVGFNRTHISIDHGAREIGTTSYNFKKLLMLAMDIILANSDKPIKLTIKLGFFVSFCAFMFGLVTIYKYFTGQILVMGYTSLLISIWFLSGLILCVLGIVGLYIGKTFEGVKNRPIYIVDLKNNFDD